MMRRLRTRARRSARSKLLETGRRVVLRAPVAADVSELARLGRASQALHRPWVYPPTTARALTRWLEAAGPTRVRLVVCRRADGAIVGVVNLNEIVRAAFQSAYLGYYAFQSHAGQGYMTEGLGLVLRHAFRRLGLHRLEANIQPGNRASLGLVRRLGFRKEGFSPQYLKIGGRWRDHERWAIVREGCGAGRARSPRAGAAAARSRRRRPR
jgi:ribosomal-protein-alanine N-acetyltransferase